MKNVENTKNEMHTQLHSTMEPICEHLETALSHWPTTLKTDDILTWPGPSLAIMTSGYLGAMGLFENSGKESWLQLNEV